MNFDSYEQPTVLRSWYGQKVLKLKDGFPEYFKLLPSRPVRNAPHGDSQRWPAVAAELLYNTPADKQAPRYK